MTEPHIHVHRSPDDLAKEVSSRFLDLVAQVQADRGTAHVVLTGGTIADLVHRDIARRAANSNVDWARVVFWWGDERIVPADSAARNELQARQALFDHVFVPESNIRAIPGSDVGDAHAAAARYAHTLSEAPELFDLVMLGIGPDGHVASLFPGQAQVDAVGATVAVLDSPKPPPERVSMTFPRLNATRQTWMMASGAGKADAVADALARTADSTDSVLRLPARGVRGREQTHWFLDEDAASRR